jgi:protein SCO1/2
LGKLAEATARLGDAAMRVKVLFISVDPKRDTPASPGRYVNPSTRITTSARQARIRHQGAHTALSRRDQLEASRRHGGYEVTHSSTVYIFDTKGHARLISGEDDPVDAFVHDIRQFVEESARVHRRACRLATSLRDIRPHLPTFERVA